MQAQHYSLPFHHQPLYDSMSGIYIAPEVSNHYLPTDALDHAVFSRGSPQTYPYLNYDYFPDRGDPSRLFECSSSPSASDECATGITYPGISCPLSGSVFSQPEEISDYEPHRQWQWPAASESLHGVTLASSAHKSQPRLDRSMIKSSVNHADTPTIVLSPAAQLPTPAAMAVLLNPNARSERQPSQIPFEQPPSRSSNIQVPQVAVATRQSLPLEPEQTDTVEGASREKKHGCTMCHKRFDRPSTLKKHLLVHTGEKAFVCNTCGRRFGVASNLNRHVKRCILKPVNTCSSGKPAPSLPSPPNMPTSPDQSASPSGQSQCSAGVRQPSKKDPNVPKRRRRAPSPSRWIPPSLLSFNLSPPEAQKATPVPLPPVRRNLPLEERDSWDENVASSPYHPRGWKNVLPGPALRIDLGFGGKDVRNLNLGGNGGFMGRVLVF